MLRVSFRVWLFISLAFSLFKSASATEAAPSDDSNAEIVVIGVIDFVPYHIPQAPGRSGLHNEVIRALINTSGIEADVRHLPPRRLIEAIDAAQIDLALFSDFITRVNDNLNDLGLVFNDANHSLIMFNETGQSYQTSLRDKTVVVPNMRVVDTMADALEGMNFIQIQDYAVALKMLSTGRVEAVLGLEPTLRYFSQLAAPNADFHYEVLVPSNVHLYRNNLSRHSNDLWLRLAQARQTLYQTGIFFEISERYMPG